MISYYFPIKLSKSKDYQSQDQAHGNSLDVNSIFALSDMHTEWNLVVYSPLFAKQKTVTMTGNANFNISAGAKIFWWSIILNTG